MLEDAKEHFDIKRREYKSLNKEVKALKQTLDELKATHERLEEAHEKLGKAHKKLEKTHSSLLNEQNKKRHVKTCNVSLTCDLIDTSLSIPIIVAPTNPSCSTSTSVSSSSDGLTCDASLMVENENLKRRSISSFTPWLRPMVVRTACLCAWVVKELLSTKRDWATPPRKAKQPLLLTRLVL